jgi:heptaprenyl diphosphate synthase
MMKQSTPSSNDIGRRVALTGMMASLALIFSYVEVLFPFNAGIPGVKLGLANLVPLIILYRLDARYAFAANLIRVILAGLLFSGLFAALYSLAGSLASFLVMYLLKKTRLFSVIGVSTAGGVFHNLGQLTVAMLAVSGPQLIHYMPVLIISGMIAGIIVGIGAAILLDRIPEKLFRA